MWSISELHRFSVSSWQQLTNSFSQPHFALTYILPTHTLNIHSTQPCSHLVQSYPTWSVQNKSLPCNILWVIAYPTQNSEAHTSCMRQITVMMAFFHSCRHSVMEWFDNESVLKLTKRQTDQKWNKRPHLASIAGWSGRFRCASHVCQKSHFLLF